MLNELWKWTLLSMHDPKCSSLIEAVIRNLFELAFCSLELSLYARAHNLHEVADDVENQSREEWSDASHLLKIAGRLGSREPTLDRRPLFEHTVGAALMSASSLAETIQRQLQACGGTCVDQSLLEALRTVDSRHTYRLDALGSLLSVLREAQK